jgi:hypothetical protein
LRVEFKSYEIISQTEKPGERPSFGNLNPATLVPAFIGKKDSTQVLS